MVYNIYHNAKQLSIRIYYIRVNYVPYHYHQIIFYSITHILGKNIINLLTIYSHIAFYVRQ